MYMYSSIIIIAIAIVIVITIMLIVGRGRAASDSPGPCPPASWPQCRAPVESERVSRSKFPGALPVFCGISPFQKKILIESNP